MNYAIDCAVREMRQSGYLSDATRGTLSPQQYNYVVAEACRDEAPFQTREPNEDSL